MSSMNKLSLKEYVRTQQPSKQYQNDNSYISGYQLQQKSLKSERKSSNRENKKLKLNTLPCEQVQKDKQENEKFLFRSTWQDDIQLFKQDIKGCTSPTFATQVLSNANHHSSLFPASDQVNQQSEECSKKTRMSNSRSKSKQKKSLQKFIGDNVSSHRPSHSAVQNGARQTKEQSQLAIINANEDQKYMYEIRKLESISNQLRRQNKKLEQKYQQVKKKCQQLEEQATQNGNHNKNNMMTNQQLLDRMKNESFWKFYLKAQKMIRASMQEGNQQFSSSPINLMKQLEALREMTSEMKKENKSLKKICEQKSEQVQDSRDKLSVQQADIEEMRLKCVAYQSTIKKLRQQINKNQKDLQKLRDLKQISEKLSLKNQENSSLTKQLNSLKQQFQEQEILNRECQKERLSTKKKCQQQNQQINSLNKQLSSLKTSYNLLEMEKQELSANKKELIEKERLKQKVYQLQKEIKSISVSKQNQISRLREQCEAKFGREIEVKESRVKQLDQKVEQVLINISQLQQKNVMYSQNNLKLTKEIQQLQQQNSQLERQLKGVHQQLSNIHQQKQYRLSQLSGELETLTSKLDEQSTSLLTQQKLIQQLRRQIQQKQQLLKVKEYESQKLRASLIVIQEQQNSRSKQNDFSQHGSQQSRVQQSREKTELEEYVARLQQKHNQALQLYQTVYNQKVELQMQLHCYEQQIQKLQSQYNPLPLEQGRFPLQLQDTLQLIESLLTIKEEIIKKTLVFCPSHYKQLLVEYIYCADMIKENYIQILNSQTQNHHHSQNYRHNHSHENYQNHPTQHDQSYLQLEEDENFYHESQTRRNYPSSHQNSTYNRTKPYQSRQPLYEADTSRCPNESEPQENQIQSKQKQINQLLQQFIQIGKIIDEQTRQGSQKSQSNKNKSLTLQMNRQKEQEFRRSKEKQTQKSRNILHQINNKINRVKQNDINDQNSFHYKLASNQFQKKPLSKNPKQFSEDQRYPSQPISKPYRQPLQLIKQKSPPNISRPLFTTKDIKIKHPNIVRNTHQQNQNFQRPFQEHNSVQRPNIIPSQQTPYQKASQNPGKNNFNHGIINKLSMLKMVDRIRQ